MKRPHDEYLSGAEFSGAANGENLDGTGRIAGAFKAAHLNNWLSKFWKGTEHGLLLCGDYACETTKEEGKGVWFKSELFHGL